MYPGLSACISRCRLRSLLLETIYITIKTSLYWDISFYLSITNPPSITKVHQPMHPDTKRMSIRNLSGITDPPVDRLVHPSVLLLLAGDLQAGVLLQRFRGGGGGIMISR